MTHGVRGGADVQQARLLEDRGCGRDPFIPAGGGAAYRDKFSGPYAHRTLKGIGHNVPQEAPEAFADAVVEADRLRRR
ncbi:alpha/beta fold hydrolase [Streptomyces rhizosphaericus]|uniref:alpha/beta fold hydrolase n=1 Tax=Streptomyces rhizosphaericus TaxID=114699 RepID=UPI0035D3EAB8